VHWAIQAVDPDRQRAFYAALFNWEIGDGPIMNIEAGLGGPDPGPAGHIQQGANPALQIYVQVRQLEAAMDKAVELGGAVLMGRLDIPGGASIAAITDPEGNTVGLVQQ
jgi:uncharacterized protein